MQCVQESPALAAFLARTAMWLYLQNLKRAREAENSTLSATLYTVTLSALTVRMHSTREPISFSR